MRLKSFAPQNVTWRTRLALDNLRGLDFLTILQPEQVGLDSSCAFRSSPSGNKYLRSVLRDFAISTADSIVDVGCGKGSAMRTMLGFPFSRVDGIELSDKIAEIAKKNFATLKAKRATIFAGDASLFTNWDIYSIVYFYNPFPATVMSRVIDSIVRSLRKSDRECCIIYNNPTCHDAVVASGFFKRAGSYPDEWGNGIAIYSNRAASASRLSANRRMQPDAGYRPRR